MYTGDFVWNAEPHGKYTQVRGGQVHRVNGDGATPASDEPDEIFIPNNHPAIVSHEKFDVAQVRLSQQRKNNSGFSPRPDRYALTGLLWCGKCGQRMQGKHEGKKPFYMCGGHGRGLCNRNSVRQDQLLMEIFGAVQSHFTDDPARVERFRQAARKVADGHGGRHHKTTVSRLENRIAALNQKLERAHSRLILVDDDMLPTVQKQIGKLRDERDQLSAQLQAAKTSVCGTITDVDAHVDKLVNRLQALQQAVPRMDIPLVRNFMQAAVNRISVDVSARQIGKRMRYRLTGGEIQLTPSCCGLSAGRTCEHPRVRLETRFQ